MSGRFQKLMQFTRAGLLIGALFLLVLTCGKKSPNGPPPEGKWTSSNAGLANLNIKCLAVHPVDPDILFAGTFDGLYRSEDGAQTWARLDSGWAYTEITAVTFDALANDVMYVGTNGSGVYKSTDRGETWELMIVGLTDFVVYSVTADPVRSDTLYTGCDGDIYMSYDGANQWLWSRGLQRAFVAVDPQTPDNVYGGGKWNQFLRSQDAGSTWVTSSEGIPPGGPDKRIQWILIDPVDPRILYVSSNNIGVCKSVDMARHWIEKNSGISGTRNVRVIALDRSNTSHIYVGTNKGIWRSTDAAETWQEMNEGLGSLDVRSVAVDPHSSGVIYTGTWGGGVFIWKP
jgi:photosystem II stability/assembly factor-like uncharacterized protein